MTFTTPKTRASEHKTWHSFRKGGGCMYCGFGCDDCPLGVATCKCEFEDGKSVPRKHEDFSDSPHMAHTCRMWCKVHWYWHFGRKQHERYPQIVNYRTGLDDAWRSTNVHVGPPAYHPRSEKL